MKIIANVATYPARKDNCLPAFRSISRQVDVLNIVLNEYNEIPSYFNEISNANFIMPENDLKDVGKFYLKCNPDDHVFLCDDDIIYPEDYVSRLMMCGDKIKKQNVIFGVHGTIYSDYYDAFAKKISSGTRSTGRLLYHFTHELTEMKPVNQLGTGTIYMRGYQMPTFDFMRTSSRFVDIRFARHAYKEKYPLFCIARENEWMVPIKNEETIYDTFTKIMPFDVLLEVQEFAGISRLMK